MRKNLRNSSNNVNRLFSKLAAEKKKTVIALCLIAVMAFMWVRVFTKRTPQAAEAALMTEQLNVEDRSNSELKISFIELPKVPGRNDVITRDFFASDGWRDFVGRDGQKSVNIQEVNIVSEDGKQEVIRTVAKKLNLQAIVLGVNPRAFINDKLLSVGDKLLIKNGIDVYECELVEIQENMVVIGCREAKITLKLKQIVQNGE